MWGIMPTSNALLNHSLGNVYLILCLMAGDSVVNLYAVKETLAMLVFRYLTIVNFFCYY